MSAFPTPFDRLTDINALLSAVRKLEKSSGWKSSVQRITCNRLSFCTALRKSLIDGTYGPRKGFKFIVNERGCRRFIRALDPADMVLQHALCDAVLLPALTPYLIYDNGASLRGKGMAFTRRRLAAHLREYRRRPVRETFARERRRLKTLYQLALCGKITVTDYKDLYHSWRSGWIRFGCHRSLISLDKTYRRYLNDLQY